MRPCATPAAVASPWAPPLDITARQLKYGTDYVSNTAIHRLGLRGMPQLYDLDLSSGPQHQSNRRHASRARSAPWDSTSPISCCPERDPIGKEIRVDTSDCEMIGVGEKARLGDWAMSRDAWVILPITTFQQNLQQRRFGAHLGQGRRHAGLDPTMDEVRHDPARPAAPAATAPRTIS